MSKTISITMATRIMLTAGLNAETISLAARPTAITVCVNAKPSSHTNKTESPQRSLHIYEIIIIQSHTHILYTELLKNIAQNNEKVLKHKVIKEPLSIQDKRLLS